MKILDVTFDYETLGRGADAAPIQLAAVAWDREATGEHPFLVEHFNRGFNLTSCVFAGLKVEQETVDWWNSQSEEAKNGVLELKQYDLQEVIELFVCDWLPGVKHEHNADAVCLWCQGTDFDVSMLRHQCRLLGIGIDKMIDYQTFCDARSFVLQGLQLLQPDDVDMTNPREAYNLIPSMKLINVSMPAPLERALNSCPHNALYDCMRSTWNVWNVMNVMRGPMNWKSLV